MGPRVVTTNWARIEALNIPSTGALAASPAKPRLVKRGPAKAVLPAKPTVLWTHRIAA
jgi:hypothetical protein